MCNPEPTTLAEYCESVSANVMNNAVSMQGMTDVEAAHATPTAKDSLNQSLLDELQNVGSCAQVPTLPTDPLARKQFPICTGVLDYFPDALAAVAACSKAGNDQHNPGEPLRWAREKSSDHADCLVRHLVERGTKDVDGIAHSAKCAWRALALLQLEIESGK